jgi:hypothetical protein
MPLARSIDGPITVTQASADSRAAATGVCDMRAVSQFEESVAAG